MAKITTAAAGIDVTRKEGRDIIIVLVVVGVVGIVLIKYVVGNVTEGIGDAFKDVTDKIGDISEDLTAGITDKYDDTKTAISDKIENFAPLGVYTPITPEGSRAREIGIRPAAKEAAEPTIVYKKIMGAKEFFIRRGWL